MTSVRTRFAPSPTGYMHIGGMRTALFNWLWARHNNGQFILRIDDTDKQRNIEEAIEPILGAFRWLGLDWDEGPEIGGPHGPYYQSQRGDLYREALDRLLAEGSAFRDYDPPELTRADREAAEKEKRPRLNIRRSLELTDAERKAYEDEGRPFVVRLLVNRDHSVSVNDHVRGRVEWDCGLLPDPVIARSDGSPLYNFATVVDDAQLEITHVIRAEEHLSNTPIQLLIHEALGHEPPEFAHIPFITAPGSNRKLSKRDGPKLRNNPKLRSFYQRADAVFPMLGIEDTDALNPVMVEYYERIGFLREGVLNALARLGWSLDDKTEILSLETVIKSFTLDRVVKASAGLDPEKLMSYQSHWMNHLSTDEKTAGCLPFLIEAGLVRSEIDDATRQRVSRVITALGDRLKVYSDILESTEFFLPDADLRYNEKALDKRLRKQPESVELLKGFREILDTTDPFDTDSLEEGLHDFVESRDVKIGQIIHALRVAVTGKAKGPGMFECLELIGRESCLKRIDQALGRL